MNAVTKPRRIWFLKKATVIRVTILVVLILVLLAGAILFMVAMPGRSHEGPLDPLTEQEQRSLLRLKGHVEMLAGTIGNRNLAAFQDLERAADYIRKQLAACGYVVRLEPFDVGGKTCHNLVAESWGSERSAEILVLGAHYDSVSNCPGANDNATGVAVLLELARLSAQAPHQRTIRFVAFANEEPPYFQTESMGSRVHARRSRERGEQLVGMLSLETLGCYLDTEDSQSYPPPLGLLYPSTGNFVCFVGNLKSRSLVRRCIDVFRTSTRFPSEGAALPGFIPGIGWSDHWSFWQEGSPALMVTDTAPFRYAHYHTREDTPDKVDYERLARVAMGLQRVTIALADGGVR